MITIKILKNGNSVKQYTCPRNMKLKYLNLAIDVAGGMYNGKDEFEVIVEE